MSRAIHRKPFSFSRLSILAYVHSPFNDHGEPVSSLLDRSLRLKARCLSASPHYSPFSGVFLVENNWPGHGSSRRLPHQRRWSRSHWGANQPSGSGCPSQPGWLCFTWQHIHKLFNFQLKWYNALNIISVFDPTWDIWRGWPWSFPPERRNPQGSEEFSLTKKSNCHLIRFEHTLCPHWSLKGWTCWGERRWGPSPWCCQQGTSGRGKEN